MVITELVAKLGLEVDEGAFAKIGAALANLNKGWIAVAGAVGAAAVGVIGATVAVAEAGDEASATAEKLSVTTQALQSLEFAAKASDTTAEALQSGLKSIGKNAVEAAQGSEELSKAFARVGVRGAELTKSSPDELLKRVATGFSELPQGVEKTNLALTIFGRAGLELVPLLNRGAEGIQALQDKAAELGIVMSSETIKASEEFDDALKELNGSLLGLRNSFAPMIPMLTNFVRKALIPAAMWLSKKLKPALEWLANEGLPGFAAAAKVVAQVLRAVAIAAGVAGVAIGVTMVPSLWFAVTGFFAMNGGIWGVITALWGLYGTTIAAVAWIAFLGAAIVLLYDDIYEFATGGKSVLGEFIKWLETPLPDDGFLWQLFKLLAGGIFDIEKFSSKFQKAFELVIGKTIDWAVEKLRQFGINIPSVISEGLKKGLGIGGSILGNLNPAVGLSNAIGAFRNLSEGGSFFSGGAESPSAAIARQREVAVNRQGNLVQAPQFSATISVTSPAGLNPTEVGQGVVSAFEKWHDSKVSDAYEAAK